MPPRKRVEKNDDAKKSSMRETSGVSSAHAQEGEEPADQNKQRKRKDGVKWFPVLKRLFYVSLLVLVPMLLNYAALNHELRVLVPQGAAVYDVGWGQKLLLHCTGSGLPTVILDAPIGQTSIAWSLVQPLIAKQTRVCSYDRAGLGFSDRAYQNTSMYANDFSEAAVQRDRTHPSTVERMVEDLHRLLTVASSQPKPFLLVSSDFTTLVSRFYAQLYEYELAGLFLIDPAPETLFDAKPEGESHPDTPPEESDGQEEYSTPWSQYWYRRTVPHLQSVHLSGSLGFNRLGLMLGLMSPVEIPELQRVLPSEVVTRKKHLLCQPKHLSSAFDEYYFMNESIAQIKTVFRVKPFPELLPVRIATFKDTNINLPQELTTIWSSEQERLIDVVHPNSLGVTLPGSDYLTMYLNPRSVAMAVVDMVMDWRGHSHRRE